MNTLEKEIDAEVFGKEGIVLSERVVKAAASVAMKWMVRAFEAGGDRSTFHGRPGIDDAPTYSEWLELNGLTPTESEPGKVIPTDRKVDATND